MKKVIGFLTVVTLFVFGLSACVTTDTRYISASDSPQPQKTGISAQDNNVMVSLDYIVYPNGPGSWVKDARWHEYIITIRNIAGKPVSVEAVRIIDPRGIYINQGEGVGPLEAATESLMSIYKDVGINMAATASGLSAVYTAAPLSAIPFLGPLVSMGGAAVQNRKTQVAAKDAQNIQDEFIRRRLLTPTMAADATITGSVFFPIIPNPKMLVIDYRVGTEGKTVQLPLEKVLTQKEVKE